MHLLRTEAAREGQHGDVGGHDVGIGLFKRGKFQAANGLGRHQVGIGPLPAAQQKPLRQERVIDVPSDRVAIAEDIRALLSDVLGIAPERAAGLHPFMRRRGLGERQRGEVDAGQRVLALGGEVAPLAGIDGQIERYAPTGAAQLQRTLNEHLFTSCAERTALFLPPTGYRLLDRLAVPVERLGLTFARRFAGVVLIEAEKQIYVGTPAVKPERAGNRRYLAMPEGLVAARQMAGSEHAPDRRRGRSLGTGNRSSSGP